MFLSWSYDFTEIESEEDIVYFSFNFPYSYEDTISFTEDLKNRVEKYNEGIRNN